MTAIGVQAHFDSPGEAQKAAAAMPHDAQAVKNNALAMSSSFGWMGAEVIRPTKQEHMDASEDATPV